MKPRIGWEDYSAQASRRSNRWAASDRGWLFDGKRERSLGNYLDYGPDHYRSPHEYCRPNACTCRASQPGNVHAIVYRGDQGATTCHYFETVEQAKAWIEQTAAKLAAGEWVAA